MKGYWYDKVNVSIFLCNKHDAENDVHCAKGAVTEDQKKQILADLRGMPVVEKVTYESQDEAYKHYKEQFGNSPLAGSLTPDQMQESYRIKLKDPAEVPGDRLRVQRAGRRAVGAGPEGHPGQPLPAAEPDEPGRARRDGDDADRRPCC